MTRSISPILLLLLICLPCLAVPQPVVAQDTGSQVIKLFQEFNQTNKFPLPSIPWDDFVRARNNTSGELPALLTKPLTAVKGGSTSSGSTGLTYEGDLVYYIPGTVCWQVEMADGEMTVYGGFTLITIIKEYANANQATNAVDMQINDIKSSLSSDEKFQSRAVSVKQSKGIEYTWLRERVLEGFDNKKTSEYQQARLWAQGRFLIFLGSGYEGCSAKGPDAFTLSDQFYDLVNKYLTGSSNAPTATPTPAGFRTLKGQVSDGFTHPLPFVFVRMAYGTNEEVTRTDENGNYVFTNLPDTAVTGYDPVKDAVHLEIMLQYLDKPPVKQRIYDPVYQLYFEKVDASTLIKVTTTDIPLAANGAPTTFNVNLGNAGTQKSATLPAPRLRRAGLVYFHLSQAVALAVRLGPPLTMLPIDVTIDHADLAGEPDALAWWDGNRGTATRARPAINFTKRVSTAPLSEVAYVTWHEFGHHFMADTYGDNLPVSEGRKSHGGYCLNNSSNDSWLEGWAMFFAALVNKEIVKSPTYWRIERDSTSTYDLESKLKAWHNEAIAVAGILMDLIDSDGLYAGDKDKKGKDDDAVTLSVNELWQVIAYGASAEEGSNNHIFDVYDLYANLKALKSGDKTGEIKPSDLDAIFIQHGFFELENPKVDDTYKPGLRIGWSSHARYRNYQDETGKEYWCEEMKPRRLDPPMMGSFIQLDLSSSAPEIEFHVEVNYSTANTYRNYAYTFLSGDLNDGRVYLLLPPPEDSATVRINSGTQAVEVTSAEFWSKLPSASDTPLKTISMTGSSVNPQASVWVLVFTIFGVTLTLIIVIAGMNQMKKQAIQPSRFGQALPNPARYQSSRQPPRRIPPSR